MICGEGGVLADMRVYPGNGDDALLFAHARNYLRDLLALARAARALQVADRRHGLEMAPEVEVAMGALFAALAPLLEKGEGDG